MAQTPSSSQSQPDRDQPNRFSKPMIARVVGVGLFVALGTVAVVYTMNRSKGVTGTAQVDEEPAADEQDFSEAHMIQPAQATISDFSADNSRSSFGPESWSSNGANEAPPDRGFTVNQPGPMFAPVPNNDSHQSSLQSPPDRFASLAPVDMGGARPQSPIEESQSAPPSRTQNREEVRFGAFDPEVPKPNDPMAIPSPNSDFPSPNPARSEPEPLGPFSQPDPIHRLAATDDSTAPNLRAPMPSNRSDFAAESSDPFGRRYSEPAKEMESLSPNDPPTAFGASDPVDARNPDDGFNAGQSGGSVLQPFAPLQQEPQRTEPSSVPPTAFAPQLSNPTPNPNPESRTPNPEPRSMDGDRLSPANLSDSPMRIPVGAPLNGNSGNPNLQPLTGSSAPSGMMASGQPAVQPNPNPNTGNSTRPNSMRTANVPGDRKLDGAQTPALTVERLSPREITVNEVADFVIVIRNVGRVDADEVEVHDQVPANTDFQGSNPPPVSLTPDKKLLWSVGTIKAGQEKRIQYQLKPLQQGEIGSVASVTFSTQASMRTLVTNPVLEISHRAKPTAMIGSNIIFDVIVTNKGNGPAKNVLIQEDVPPQLQFQEGFRELEFEVGTLAPGQTKQIQLTLKAVGVGRIKNTVIATAAGGQRSQHDIDLEIVSPQLQVNADGPTRRYLGRNVAHQFRVANPGTASATNVELIAKLPAGLRFVRANNQGVYRQSAHAVLWSMAELAANGTAEVELTTMPADVGQQDINFEVHADLGQRASVVQPLGIEHLVDVAFDIDDTVDPIEVGAETSYMIKVVNQGTLAASNINLQVEFPAGLRPVSVDGQYQGQINGQRVQFPPINNLKPGEQLQIQIRAQGQTPGDHRVVVSLHADGRQSAASKEEITRVYTDR